MTAMSALQDEGLAFTDNGTQASLSFKSVGAGLSLLEVEFADKPVPRQAGSEEAFPDLAPGRYALEDAFKVAAPNNLTGSATLNWQFYVTEASFRDGKVISKGAALNEITQTATGPKRIITPFASFPLRQDCVVTWRAIVIMDAPVALTA